MTGEAQGFILDPVTNFRRPIGVAVVLGSALVACFTTLQLSSTQQKTVVLNTMAYDFGQVPLHTTSMTGANMFVISPQTQSDDDYVTSIVPFNCPQFAVQLQPPLGSGGGSAHVYYSCLQSGSGSTTELAGSGTICTPITYSFGASFTPTQAGSQQCDVDISTTPGSGGTIQFLILTLSGSGSASTYSMIVNPTMLPFGDVPITTTSSPQGVTVTNTGTGSLTLKPLVNTNPTVYQVSGLMTAGGTLAAGSAAQYSVTCTPALGTNAGMLTFNTAEGPMGQVGMSCKGISSSLTITPSPVTFPSTLVGRQATDQQVMITSADPTQILTMVALASDTAGVSIIGTNPQGMTVGMGQTVTLRYDGAVAHPEGELTQLVVEGSVDNMPIDVIINGEALVGSIGTTPASVDFGPVCAGGSASMMVNVSTNAPGPVDVSGMAPPGSPFSATAAPALPLTLPGNGGSGFTITATVHPTSAGEQNAKIALATNIPGSGAERDIPMHATVLSGGNAPTPDSLHFGVVGVGMTSAEKDTVITNCEMAGLDITGAHLEGPNAGDFDLPPVMAQSLPQGQSLSVAVLMHPQANGVRTATLVIDGPNVSVPLDGTGFGGTGDGTKDRETYYACSAGRAVGLAPLGLAVAFVIARRRRRRSA